MNPNEPHLKGRYSMKAMVYRRYGAPDVLRLEEAEKPAPGEHDLLVKVKASSLNAVDLHFLRASPALVRFQNGFFRPKNKILGYDIAGLVETVGKKVTRFKPGDAVFGGLGFCMGGFAEYACIREDAFMAGIPGNITFEQAAAVPGAAAAALIALHQRGKLESGQKVLVNGASGGTGTFSVQIAKAAGARVTGVCSTRNLERVRKLGADQVIDYTRDDFSLNESDYDLLLDNVGNRSVEDLLRPVRSGGTVVIVGFTSMGLMLKQSLFGPGAAGKRHITWAKPASEEPTPAHAETLRDLLETGKIVPEIEKSYPLKQLPEAIRYMETEHAKAKIVIVMENT